MDKSQRRNGTWQNLETAVNTLKDEKKEKDNYDIPGVTKVVITPITQKAIGCVVGEDLTLDEPYVYVQKEKLEGNIYLHNKNSVFLPVKKEIIEYPEKNVLLVLDTKSIQSNEDFFVCVTTEAKESILNVIEKEKDQLLLRMKKCIEKTPRKWKSLGSEIEIDETLSRNFRSLFEIEISSKWPINDKKVRFSMRNVEDAKDGYMELVSERPLPPQVNRRRIDVAIQVIAEKTTNEAQTNPSYPKNAWTQYGFEPNLKELTEEKEKSIFNFVTREISKFENNIRVNDGIDFYADDYGNLVTRPHVQIDIPRQDFISFQNVISCKNKSVASVSWHPLISGLIAAAYARISCNEIYSAEPLVDTKLDNAYGQHLVLLWSHTNHLKPILYLEAHRDVKCISFCPLNPNFVVGGCSNGQIVIWDITEAIETCEKNEVLTELQQKHRVILYSHMNWLKNVEDMPVIEPVVISHIDCGHKSVVTDITWLPSNYEIKQNGYIERCDNQINLQFLTCSADSIVYLWDLKNEPEITIPKNIKHSERLKQKPSGLLNFKSELAKFNKVFIPYFKFQIEEPLAKTNIPLTKILIEEQKINYNPTNPETVNNEQQRTYFNFEIDKEPWKFTPKLILTSNTGQLLNHTWQSYEIDPDADEIETFETTKFISIHDGPIDTCLRNPFIPELLLTVGGKIFAVWNESSKKTSPIIWRKSKLRYLNGTWSSYHPGIVIMFRYDSHFEIWNLLEGTKDPDYVIRYTGNVIVDAFCETDKNHVRKNTYCTIDNTGAVKIYKVPYIPHEGKRDLVKYARDIFLHHEIRRNLLKQWTADWKKKYIKTEETKVKAIEKPKTVPGVEDLFEIKSLIKRAKFENVDKENARKWNEKQYDIMYKILIDKRKLNLNEIEERKQPLLQAVEERKNRDEKEKLLLSNRDDIFKRAKRLLCEEIKINPRRQLTASVSKLKSIPQLKVSYITEYKKLETNTLEYIKSNPFEYTFNWNKMINEGRIRRKVFNTHIIKENLHRQRWAMKKQPVPVIEEEEVSKINEPPKLEKLKKNVQDIIFIKKHIISG